MPVTCSKSKIFLPYLHVSSQEEGTQVHRQTHFLTGNGLCAHTVISPMYSTALRKTQCQGLQLSPSVPLYGVCITDESEKSQEHRSVPSGIAQQTSSDRHWRQHISKHIRQCQQGAYLDHLCRSRSTPYQHVRQALRKSRFWFATRPVRLRSRRNNHRSLFISVSVDQFQENQNGHQPSDTSGFAGQYFRLHSYKRWPALRHEHPRPTCTVTRLFLRQGQAIPRNTLRAYAMRTIFCHASQIQSTASSALFSFRQLKHRTQMPQGHPTKSLLVFEELSGQISTHQLLRCRDQQNADFPDQQFFSARVHLHPTVILMSVAGRTVFQMDKAAPGN